MFLAHKSMVQMNFYYKKQCWTFSENASFDLENTFDKIQKSFWLRGVIDTPKYDSMTSWCPWRVCDVKFSQIEGNGRKFRNRELSTTYSVISKIG